MRLEREYSNATASRSSAHLFTNTDGLDLLDVRRDGSVLVGPATSYSTRVGPLGRGWERFQPAVKTAMSSRRVPLEGKFVRLSDRLLRIPKCSTWQAISRGPCSGDAAVSQGHDADAGWQAFLRAASGVHASRS